MKRLLLVTLLTVGCSDIHYLREADAAYEVAVGQHDQMCVKKANVRDQGQYEQCEEERMYLKEIKEELDWLTAAMQKGQLPKTSRGRIKQIAKELEAREPLR